MNIRTEDFVTSRLTEIGAQVHNVKVTSEGSVLVYDASYGPGETPIPDIPVLFLHLCVSGGGRMIQRTSRQNFDKVIGPGHIGILAPSAPGYGSRPEIRVITVGIETGVLFESFGRSWPRRLRSDVISQPFRDPFVEATMTQIGHAYAGQMTDSVIFHAAHMLAHQLLDDPVDVKKDQRSDAHPLSPAVIGRIADHVVDHIDRNIPVEELAQLVGVSRHHFSRRFKAATGTSPYKYVMTIKLDRAAKALTTMDELSITDVSASVGYNNPAQFAKAFRRRFGTPPRVWRSIHT